MGNILRLSSDKPIQDQKEQARRHVYRAQDFFVQSKMELKDVTDCSFHDTKFDQTDIVPLYNDDYVNDNQGALGKIYVGAVVDEIDVEAISVDIKKYQFPFENLVFEGGGVKGLAYCGAIKVLEELDIMPQIKRYAGASAGAMAAALLAVGYSADETRKFLSQDLSKLLLDHSCGYFSLLPNLLSAFGWNPGNRIFKWFGETIAKKTGNPDVTFYEVLFTMKGKELCILVTDLNLMTAKHCHPKTTPDMPIRLALRMSMSIPGLFQAIRHEEYGQHSWYVDGGVLDNYPINCFDGWWLSMDQKDSFLNRLQPIEEFHKFFDKKERFGTFNTKTLGFLLYADSEQDVLRDALETRQGTKSTEFPPTKLGRYKLKKMMGMKMAASENRCTLNAVDAFLKVLKKCNTNMDEFIDRKELQNALIDDGFAEDQFERIFGTTTELKDVFDAMEVTKDDKISVQELVHFIERMGISLHTRFLGYQRKEIDGVFSFFSTLQSAQLLNLKRNMVEDIDIYRTVGINTAHVDTTDFILEEEDIEFVVQQGRRATENFLRCYVKNHSGESTAQV